MYCNPAKDVRARFRLPGTVSRRTGRRLGLWYACALEQGAPCVCSSNGGGGPACTISTPN